MLVLIPSLVFLLCLPWYTSMSGIAGQIDCRKFRKRDSGSLIRTEVWICCKEMPQGVVKGNGSSVEALIL